MSLKCGFIGCGNMGSALAIAVAKGNPNVSLFFSDLDHKKAIGLADMIQGTVVDFQWLCENCDVIFLGVKPQGIVSLFQNISPLLQQRENKPLLVSMAAGVSINTIEQLAGIPLSIVRIMPNTPVKLGVGMIEICSNQQTTQEQLDLVLQLLHQAGELDVISEELIDAASAIAGSGPAFVYLFAELLAKGAQECGIPTDKGVRYAAQTLLGAASMILKEDKTPEELRIAVCSPGGSTLAGLTALETKEFENAVTQSVILAYQRSKELGKV